MPKIPGASEDQAVRALKKAGLVILRQGKHVVLSNGDARLTIPRHNPINAYTMGASADTAVGGLTGTAPSDGRPELAFLATSPDFSTKGASGRAAASSRSRDSAG
jgi:predicted RNA binding protein YcfA (HicA-like mRNA interferase family)